MSIFPLPCNAQSEVKDLVVYYSGDKESVIKEIEYGDCYFPDFTFNIDTMIKDTSLFTLKDLMGSDTALGNDCYIQADLLASRHRNKIVVLYLDNGGKEYDSIGYWEWFGVVFFPLVITGKDKLKDFNLIIASYQGMERETFVHEMGHYFGLKHVKDSTNFMHSRSTGHEFTEKQLKIMKRFNDLYR